MSRRNKAWVRFLSKPADYTDDEMSGVLKGLGYQEIKAGTSSGSRVAFIHPESGHIIRLHRPHPGNIMKRYQLDFIEETLGAKGRLK